MKQCDFSMRITLLHMRPLYHEHHGTNACNDADPCATLRAGVRGISLTAPLDAQARAKVQTGLRSYWIPGSWHGRMSYTDAIPGPNPRTGVQRCRSTSRISSMRCSVIRRYATYAGQTVSPAPRVSPSTSSSAAL